MSLRLFVPGLSLLALLLAGCASYRETIDLSDNNTPFADPAAAVVPKEPGLKKSELDQIEVAVFSDLLSRHFGDDAHFSAVFITAEESRTPTLAKQFPQHLPPLKSWWHLDQRPGMSPLDRDTGQAAIVLSADVADPENGIVIALGKWFAGPSVSGFYTFALKKEGGIWAIQSVK